MPAFLGQTIITHYWSGHANVFGPDNYDAFLRLDRTKAQKEAVGFYQDAEEQTKLERAGNEPGNPRAAGA